MHSDWILIASTGLATTLHSIQQVNPLLGYNKSKPCTYTTQDAHKNLAEDLNAEP